MTRREIPRLPPGTRGLARHPALVALSRDHHGLLVQALALKRAAERPDGDAARAAVEAYLRYHDAELVGHMDDEERVLLPLGASVDPEGAARVRDEHREIEARTDRLRAEPAADAEALRALGELLDDHVRFEERGFFMRLQDGLDAAALERLDAALRAAREARGRGPACALHPRP